MVFPLLGAVIGAGASLIGGAMNNSAQAAANRANIAATEKANAQNLAAQKEFAQQGIRWRVEDAERSGIHPLYALGAQTPSFSPSFQAGHTEAGRPGDGLSAAGQDIGRAVSSTLTQPERAYNQAMMTLQMERGALENELLRSQINRERVGTMAMGTPVTGRVSGDALMFHGAPWDTNPQTTDAQSVENRYGDLVSSLYGLGVVGSDVLYNSPSPSGAATPARSFSDDYANWAARERLRVYLANPRRVGSEVYAGIY